MSTVNAAGSGLTNLLQTLSTDIPQLSSVLNSDKVQSAIQNVSPTDTIQLSDAALKLQQVGQLFGNAGGTTAGNDTLFNALANQNSTNQPDPIYPALASSLGLDTTGQASTISTTDMRTQAINALFAPPTTHMSQTVDPLINTNA